MAYVLAIVWFAAARKPLWRLRGLAAELATLNASANGGCCAMLPATML
jgi:hypothetical protein